MEPTLKDKVAKGLFWGGVSNGLQQVITLCFNVALARMLSQYEYGIFGTLIIFTSIANLLQESGFTTALVNRKHASDEDYNSVFWTTTTIGVTLYLVLFACAPAIAAYFDRPELTAAGRVLFLWFVFMATGTVHNAILLKEMKIKEKAKIDILSFLSGSVVAVTLAWLGASYWSLVFQMLVQGAVNVALRWHYSRWRPHRGFALKPLEEMFPFSVKLLITGIFGVINGNIFAWILGRYYSTDDTGYYTQGYKYGYMGYSVLWFMINSVAQPSLAQVADAPDRQMQVFRKLMRFTAYTVFPCLLGMAFVSEELITVFLTSKWAGSIPYMQLICLWSLITPISNLCTGVLISHGRSDQVMYGTIALYAVQLTVIFLSFPLGVLPMIAIYVAVNYVWFFVWFALVRRRLPVRLMYIIKDTAPYFVTVAAAIAVTYFITLPIDNLYLRLAAKVVTVAVLYVGTLHLSGSVLFRETLQYLKHKKI